MKKIRVPDIDEMRICSKCGIKKILGDFRANKSCLNGRERRCNSCVNTARQTPEQIANMKRLQRRHYEAHKDEYLARQLDRYRSDPEKFRAYGRGHAKNNPQIYRAANYRRKARIKSSINDLTSEHIKLLFDNYDFCIYCNSKDELTLDHIVPLSKGGDNTLSNCVVACWPCNNLKRARDVEEFI